MSQDFYCEQVLSGKIDVDVFSETESFLAFHHTQPSYPVHLVVIPKRHSESLLTYANGFPRELASMMAFISDIVAKVAAEHGGCRLTTNIGCFQTTRHLHWHIYVGRCMQDNYNPVSGSLSPDEGESSR